MAWQGEMLVGMQLPEDAGEAQTRARMVRRFPQLAECPMPPQVAAWAARVAAQLQGAHDNLCDVPLALDTVPPFNARVYALARRIPPGKTMTYGEMAAELGVPGAARAVGQALGHNPFAPVVPCHRVLAAGDRPGGFSAGGGALTKLRMLQMEGACPGGTPSLFGW
jgi:methylated-DNA-[protein]-cysteine S-methyltransferase